MTNNEGERLAVLEEQVRETNKKIDVLGAKFDVFTSMLSSNYVSKEIFNNSLKEIKDTVNDSKRLSWVTHTATGVIVAVLTLLLTYALTHR